MVKKQTNAGEVDFNIDTRCDGCGQIKLCAESEITGLVYCYDCFDEQEGNALCDEEMGC